MEVFPGPQAAALEDGLQALARGSRIGRGLEDDQLAPAEARCDVLDGSSENREIGLPLARKRRRQRDEDRFRVLHRVVVGRGGEEAVVNEFPQRARRDVADVALAAVDPLHDLVLDVDEHDVLARVGKGAAEGHADVSGPDDGDVRLHPAQGYLWGTAATLGTRRGR